MNAYISSRLPGATYTRPAASLVVSPERLLGPPVQESNESTAALTATTPPMMARTLWEVDIDCLEVPVEPARARPGAVHSKPYGRTLAESQPRAVIRSPTVRRGYPHVYVWKQ